MNLKTSILLMVIIMTEAIVNAQEVPLVFRYQQCNVKTVHLSKTERRDYKYLEGVIIEREDLSLGCIVERYYYHQDGERIDSIVYHAIYDDTTYVDKNTYSYSFEYEKVKTEQKLAGDRISIDSFLYTSEGLLDEAYHFENRTESIFGTVTTEKVRLIRVTKYEYDDQGHLISAKSGDGIHDWSSRCQYSDKGLKTTEIEYLGYTRNGCFRGEDQIYCYSRYWYNDKGLPVKEVNKYSLVKPNGKTRNNGRICFRWRYEYY